MAGKWKLMTNDNVTNTIHVWSVLLPNDFTESSDKPLCVVYS